MKAEKMKIKIDVDSSKAVKSIGKIKKQVQKFYSPIHRFGWARVAEIVIAGLIALLGYILLKSF